MPRSEDIRLLLVKPPGQVPSKLTIYGDPALAPGNREPGLLEGVLLDNDPNALRQPVDRQQVSTARLATGNHRPAASQGSTPNANALADQEMSDEPGVRDPGREAIRH